MKKVIIVLVLGLVLMPKSVISQTKDITITGRIQIRADINDRGENQFLVKRCRLLTSGYILPKISFRVQHDFKSNQLMDTWISYKIPNLEIRAGQSWLPWVGDFVESPFFLDMIDVPVGALLFPPRDKGVFVLGNHKSLYYKLSVVNGNGFKEENNKWKDVLGSIKYKSSFLEAEIGHYEGRKGPDNSLEVKRRSALQVLVNPNHFFTLKTGYLIGEDVVKSRGGWLRILAHLNESIDIIGEFDSFDEDSKTQYYVGGVSYYFNKNSRLMANYRYFSHSPDGQKQDFKLQLQVFY